MIHRFVKLDDKNHIDKVLSADDLLEAMKRKEWVHLTIDVNVKLRDVEVMTSMLHKIEETFSKYSGN
jgi:hypothetical protein